MVLRSAIGALVTVAILGAVATALPERKGEKPTAVAVEPPFGQLAKSQFASTDAVGPAVFTNQDAERRTLLKLASYSTPRELPPGKPAVVAGETTPAQTTSPPLATDPGKALSAATSEATQPDPAQRVMPPPPPSAAALRPAGRLVVASVEQTEDDVRSSRAVNINKAPVEALDHLPGAGRIGRAITRHRPYRNIEDLVRKRVLRETAFRRIRSSITVD